MNLIESTKRLKYTISKGNKPNQRDIEAFNEILSAYSKSESENINNNMAFCKLLALLMIEKVRKFDNVDEAIKAIGISLMLPLQVHVTNLQSVLNITQLRLYMETLKIDVPTDEYDPEVLENYCQQWHEKYDAVMWSRVLSTYDTQYTMNNFRMTANEILSTEANRL